MKLKLFVLFLMASLFVVSSALAQTNKPDKKNIKETVLFDVSMHCENCKKKIERNIAYEKGVTDMDVDLLNKTVLVEFKKDKTSIEKLQTALEKLGYDVNIHSENDKQ